MKSNLLNRFFILCLALSFLLGAQAMSSRLFTSDKLSSTSIGYILQDHRGYIWVATQYGLNRFDGYRFTQYFFDKNDTTTLINNDVACLLEDSKHRLWVGCMQGLCRYDDQRNCFVRYPFPNKLITRVLCLDEDEHGNIIIGTAGFGIYVIKAGGDMVTREPQLWQSNPHGHISVIWNDDNHTLWVGHQTSTITRMKMSKLHPTSIKDVKSPYGPVVRFLKTDKGVLLAVCMYGILRYDYATGEFVDAGYDMKALDSKVSIRWANQTHDGNLYLGTSGKGLFCIDKGSNTLRQVDNGGRYGLTSANVNYIMEDKDHNLWVSCYKKGLMEFNQDMEAFHTWTFAAQNIILGSGVSSLAADNNGGVWCTVQKSGIYHFDADGHITPAPASPPGANTIYRDKRGNYWVGSENTLYSYNPLTGASTPQLTVDGWGINSITDDGEGNFFICDFGKGLCVYNTATRQAKHLDMAHDDPKKGHLCNDWIISLFVDHSGLLWIGTTRGFCVMNPADFNFRIFGWNTQLENAKVFSFCEMPDGTMLVGTDQGLYSYDREKNQLAAFPHSEMMANKSINAIIFSSDGNFWMSSANGIWQYDAMHKQFVGHASGNGLEMREFNARAAIMDADGRIFLGGNEGIVAYHPSDVTSSKENKDGKVYLTNFIIDGKPVGTLTERFVVPYDQRTFTMEFSMLHFSIADNPSFCYRLNNGEWVTLEDGVNSVTFNRMKPGRYEVEIRAMSNGVQVGTTGPITVVVRAPWYATLWAYLAYALLAAALLVFALYYVNRRQRARLEEQKMRFLINATHDIRSPLTLILGPLNKLKQRVADPQSLDDINTIDRNAQRLLLLVNQILDERKIDKNQMRLHCSPTDLVGFIAGICSLYQYNARQRNINFNFEHADSKLMAWIDRKQFDKVVSNLLSNAFKYSQDGGQITVTLSSDGNNANLLVADTGIGFGSENTDKLFERFYQGRNTSLSHLDGTGIGLNLSRSIVLLHGGKIKAYNRTDGLQGACLEVSIPLGNKHLRPEQMEKEEPVPRKAAKRQASRNYHLLIVDDDMEVTRYVKEELSDWYRVDTAANGKDALKMLLTGEPYDLVVTDVVMPVMDGISLLREIKGNANISDIPVVVLTSKTEVSDRLEGLKKGADAYLSKPFDMEELHVLIDNLVENVRRLRGKFSGALTQADKMENVEVKGNNDALMDRVMRTINENIQDPDFGVDKLASEVGLSRTQLHRKMKEITGVSTGEFIRNLRLKQAARLISEGKINIAQAAFAVGFNNQTYFSTAFKKHFGMTPTEYAEKGLNP